MPEEDSHLPDQTRSQAHPSGARSGACSSDSGLAEPRVYPW